MMNSNTYTNKNYKTNERALADLLGQLVRGRNSSPTGFSRRGGSGMNDGGVGGSMNNFDGPSMGMRSGGGGGGMGGGGGGWGGNAPNDWNQGSGGGGGFGGSGGGFGGSGGGFGGSGGGFGGGGGGGGGNIMPLMNMNDRGGGGFGGMSRGDGMNDGYGGGMSQMPQGGGGGGMNDNFGGNFMGMSRGNQGNFGGMSSNMGMNNSNFGGGGFPQNNDDDFAAPPAPRSRGMWVSGASNRSSRNEIPALINNSSSSRSRPSNHSPPRRRRRRSLSGSKAPLSSRRIRSSARAPASGNSSRPAPASKRRAPPTVAPTRAKISNTSSSSSSIQRAKAAVASAEPRRSTAVEPRRVLTSLGGRWYQHFLKQGLSHEAARKKAFELNETKFPELPLKRKPKYPLDEYNPVRVGIFAKGFPEIMLDPEDKATLEELIVDEVANSGSNSTATKLQFERLIKKPGMLIVDCANQHTADWLKEIIPKLPNWENPVLEICEEDDLPDATVMTISLPRSAGQEYDQTLAYIQAQNDDLCTDSWEWVSERTDGERLVITIRVDKDSYNTMKENRFKIFYKFGLVEVNFARYLRYAVSKQRRREEEAAEQKEKAKADVPQNDAEDGNKEIKADDDEAGAEAEPEAEAEAEAEADAEAEAEVADANPPSPPPAPVISIDE